MHQTCVTKSAGMAFVQKKRIRSTKKKTEQQHEKGLPGKKCKTKKFCGLFKKIEKKIKNPSLDHPNHLTQTRTLLWSTPGVRLALNRTPICLRPAPAHSVALTKMRPCAMTEWVKFAIQENEEYSATFVDISYIMWRMSWTLFFSGLTPPPLQRLLHHSTMEARVLQAPHDSLILIRSCLTLLWYCSWVIRTLSPSLVKFH